MTKPARVINYYLLCNKLKDIIRAGWSVWGVQRERLESIAEHVFGVQMLAIAIQSEYHYDINFEKVILMLAVHELEETIIGDYIPFDITKEEKRKLGHEAVHKILKDLDLGVELEKLILEFDEQETKEAKFAYSCDKLEADLQCYVYDKEGCVAWPIESNRLLSDPDVRQTIEANNSWSEAWLDFSQLRQNYDENFLAISNYLKQHYINH